MKIPSLPKGAVGFPLVIVVLAVGVYVFMKRRNKVS